MYKREDADGTTLREILEAHPEWADLPIGIYQADGACHMLGELGSVYASDYTKEEIQDITEDTGEAPEEHLIFAGN